MKQQIATAAVGVLLAAQMARADASYQTTYQITGGSMVDAVKSQAFIAREANKMFAPTNTLVLVHGNQKATVSKDSMEIIDLDAGTMTHVDNTKKTYSVITFDQMRKAMQKMPEMIQQQKTQLQQAQNQTATPQTNLQMSFDVQVKDTGVSKLVNGLMATEHIITLTMKVTDPNAAANSTQTANATPATNTQMVNSVAYTVTTDMWIAPDPPQVKEIQDFDKRMAQKMMQGVDLQALAAQWKANANNGAGMGMLLGNQPGAADAMKRMGEEMAKLKGTHVLEIMTMGGYGTGPAATTMAQGTTSAPSSNTNNSGQSMAGQVAQGTAEGTAQGESGHFGVVGNALSNSVIGAFHRKKQQQQQQQAAAQQPAQTATQTGATQTTQRAVLMETTQQESNFSSEPVPTSAFQIPAGYKEVPSAFEKMSQ